MSRNIRSLCNTTHSNERYVPITGYRRHNYTKTKYINSLGHHKSKRLFLNKMFTTALPLLLGLPRRFASEVLMFFFRHILRIRKQKIKNAITLKRLKVET